MRVNIDVLIAVGPAICQFEAYFKPIFSSKNPKYQTILEKHTQILITRHEAIAAVAAGPAIASTVGSDEVITIKDPRIVIAWNDGKSADEDNEGKIMLTKLDMTGTSGPPIDPIGHVISQLAEQTNLTKQELFIAHTRTYLQYQQAVHRSETASTRHDAVTKLREYVYAKSYPKMLSRIKVGEATTRDKNTVNFWKILTINTEELPYKLTKHPISPRLRGKKPDVLQRGSIRYFWSSHPEHREAMLEADIYSSYDDRVRFQLMLRMHLLDTRTHLESFKASMEEAAEDPSEVNVQRTRIRYGYARSSMSQYLRFMKAFDEFLGTHLEWLALAAGVTDWETDPRWEAPKTSSQEDDERWPDAEENEEEINEYRELEEAIEVGRAAYSKSTRTWANAAKIYLHLPCTHEMYIHGTTTGIHRYGGRPKLGSQKFESALVLQAKVAIVNYDIKSWDQERTAIDRDFMNKLGVYESGLQPNVLLGALAEKQMTHAAPNDDKRFFGATSHCQSVLMSLAAIAADSKIMNHVDNTLLEQQGIVATTADLLAFPNLHDFHRRYKKDCPVCESSRQLFEYHNKEVAFINFGSHPRVGVILPPFIPRTLGEPALKAAMVEVAQKLLAWQDILKRSEPQKRTLSSILVQRFHRLRHRRTPEGFKDDENA